MSYTTPGTLLVDEDTGAVINVGDERLDFRGDPLTIRGWRLGAHPGSTGRVIVDAPERTFGVAEYYPGVVRAKVVEITR